MEAGTLKSNVNDFEKNEVVVGGRGSGRKSKSRKTLQDVTRLDVRELYRAGEIYHHATEYRGVPLTWTPCNYGGWRPWFVCPTCTLRCAVLYNKVCRDCTGLKYQSQYEDRITRLEQRSNAIRQRLACPGLPFWAPPDRPKHMRHTTYDALLDDLQKIGFLIAEEIADDPNALQQQIRDFFAAAKRLDRRY